MRHPFIIIAALLASLAALPAADVNQTLLSGSTKPQTGVSASRPNIIVILADDMGFSDLGCYGSEIQTPNLDKLAANGMRFTQFYNMSRCCPTRAALMTGLYAHQAGIGRMTNDENLPGYRGRLTDKCVTLAEVLKSAGYFTATTGKWHLGGDDFSVTPPQRGFDRSLSTAHGGFYYGSAAKKKDKEGPLWLNGKNLAPGSPELPQEWYTTDLFADFGSKFINEAVAEKKPFFLYLAFNAPHWPLMAPQQDIAKYRGKYMAGWDKLREQRYQRQLASGIIDSSWPLSPLPKSWKSTEDVRPWDTYSDKEKERFDQIMSIYAGCVDHLDQAVGRVVENLKAKGVLDNTLILFLSDNGGNAEGGPDGKLSDTKKGEGQSAWSGESWATLQNTPFRYFKHFQHEGGIATPLVAHWPAGITKGGTLCRERAHIIDIMATCVEVSGARYPAAFNGKPILPMEGKSLSAAFNGGKIGHEALYWEHSGQAAMLEGDWKIVCTKMAKTGDWELYNLTKDRTELHDLAATQPARVKEMAAKWETWAKRTGVLPKPDKQEKKAAK